MNKTDPSGECPWCVIGGIVNGIVSGGLEAAAQIREHGSIQSISKVLVATGTGAVAGAVSGGLAAAKNIATLTKVTLSVSASAHTKGAEILGDAIIDGKADSGQAGKEMMGAIVAGAVPIGGPVANQVIADVIKAAIGQHAADISKEQPKVEETPEIKEKED